MLKIAVIDGQGGGIGRRIIEEIRREIYWDVRITALGTNSIATAAMLGAGANSGATGENAIVSVSQDVDLILGPVGIIVANAVNGEITEVMAAAIASSPASKLLIPFNKCNIEIMGVEKNLTMTQIIEKAMRMIEIIYYENKKMSADKNISER